MGKGDQSPKMSSGKPGSITSLSPKIEAKNQTSGSSTTTTTFTTTRPPLSNRLRYSESGTSLRGFFDVGPKKDHYSDRWIAHFARHIHPWFKQGDVTLA